MFGLIKNQDDEGATVPKTNRERRKAVETVVAQRIRELRERRGWEIPQLVDALVELDSDLDYFAIRNIELGKRGVKIDEAHDLARVFDTTIDMLIRPPQTQAMDDAVNALDEYKSAKAEFAALHEQYLMQSQALSNLQRLADQARKKANNSAKNARQLLKALPKADAEGLFAYVGLKTDEELRQDHDEKMTEIRVQLEKKFANGTLTDSEGRILTNLFPDEYEMTGTITKLPVKGKS